VSRRGETDHVRHLRPGDEREARRRRQAEQVLEIAAAHFFDDTGGRAARVYRRILIPRRRQPIRGEGSGH